MLLVVLLVRHWSRSTLVLSVVSVAAGLVAAAVAFSRLALGAHYLSDVVGGWLMAAAWVLALNAALGGRAWSSGQVSRRRRSAEQPTPDRPPPRSAS
jgi:undecaprenyl-diphosphatase